MYLTRQAKLFCQIANLVANWLPSISRWGRSCGLLLWFTFVYFLRMLVTMGQFILIPAQNKDYIVRFSLPDDPSGAGGWSPLVTDSQPWFQLDLRDRMEVTAVATQGRYDSSDWVSSYMLLYSDTGRAWKQYRQEDGVGRLPGNMNSEAVVQNKLSHSIRTRFLRLLPLDWNPSGWLGLRVEVYGCGYKSDVADFDGRSSLLYRFNQKSMSTVKDVVSLRFKSRQAEGVLLHGEGQRGDYITLELHRGRLALRSSGGRSVAVSLGSLLDDQHWHSVLIERFNKQVNLTVDSHTQHFRTKGEGDSLEVDYELSFGGIPLPGKPGTFIRKNFHGCIENLYYNGINIIDLAKRRKPQIYSVGNVTFSCSQPQLVATTFVSSSASFLSLPATAAAAGSEEAGFSLRFQFRTWNADGLLLSVRLAPEPQRVELQISVKSGNRISTVRSMQPVRAQEARPTARGPRRLVCDLPSLLRPHPGCPSEGCGHPTPAAFQGCMRLIHINGVLMNLLHVQQGSLGRYHALQFDTCGIRDRCLPNYCEHGGQCSQTWSAFRCDCSGTGHTGATCHNALYEPSCEAYKLTGSSSGYYSIDPDGSGPLGPARVYCNMTEDQVWTVLDHSSSAPVRVQGSSPQKPYIMRFNYSASPEQLRAIVTGSEQCQQEVVYRCRKSRLFNIKDGTPMSWWLDQAGERRTYWGGFLPGVQQCSCGLQENCQDMNYFCNCDAATNSWSNDTGVLSYKDHLPVSQIVIGDTNRTGSEAVYRVGALRCYGDKSTWNAASFYQESSYLHFPTLQAELGSDISFYFKTSAPSGVFLENLGLKDFIRVELSSPSAVAFSFDVGNGPAVLTVKSHVPLNDRQWHYVRAERGVQEASLQVDQLPLRFLEAPADAHVRLQLNSQLFVGGTASRQRGFLGCIRTLAINGVHFNLEERARMTGSSSLCHNRGRCIEKSSGYVCDCSQSAYGGPSCREGVQSPASSLGSQPNRSSQASSVSRESSRARENVAFSFLTSQRPAMLLSVSTFSQQYIAVILATNGTPSYTHTHAHTPLHSHTPFDECMKRDRWVGDSRTLEAFHMFHVYMSSCLCLLFCTQLVREAGLRGFVGCLSSVQFNHLAPLKVALLHRGSSLLSIRGALEESNCVALAESATSHSLLGKGPLESPASSRRSARTERGACSGRFSPSEAHPEVPGAAFPGVPRREQERGCGTCWRASEGAREGGREGAGLPGMPQREGE
uniref:Contactin associated protein-like 5a n=1 Tax=Gadus morhua TaxID=8049 RepID=A0A8C5FGM1_GADMO